MKYDDLPPTLEELPELLKKHLNYEIGMFFGLAAIIPRVAGAEPEVVNAIKESLLIHARVLMDFFGPTRTKDDLMAFDYIDDWNSESHGGAELVWLEDSLGRYIDKRVAHLTAYRVRVPKADDAQYIADVVRNMSAVMCVFHRGLPDHWRRQLRFPSPEQIRNILAPYEAPLNRG